MPLDIKGGSIRPENAGNRYDAVFTDKKDNSILDPSQFLNLLVTQMQNQDFMNPMDDTQYITQMAQFSNMQQMQQMTEYSKTNYALSLVGKNVTASRMTTGGGLDTVTGTVDKVSLVNNEYIIYVSGKRYNLSQIMSIENGKATAGGGNSGDSTAKPPFDASQLPVEKGEITSTSAEISWKIPTEDETILKGMKYTVYYSEKGPFDKLEDVEKGTKFGSAQENLTKEKITGLSPDKTYYINVVATDAKGNKSIYKTLEIKTLPEEQKA